MIDPDVYQYMHECPLNWWFIRAAYGNHTHETTWIYHPFNYPQFGVGRFTRSVLKQPV